VVSKIEATTGAGASRGNASPMAMDSGVKVDDATPLTRHEMPWDGDVLPGELVDRAVMEAQPCRDSDCLDRARRDNGS
jgi:hypothetical protein